MCRLRVGVVLGNSVRLDRPGDRVAERLLQQVRGTRSCRPTRTTFSPASPPLWTYRCASSYAHVFPIRSTAAASRIERKSGTVRVPAPDVTAWSPGSGASKIQPRSRPQRLRGVPPYPPNGHAAAQTGESWRRGSCSSSGIEGPIRGTRPSTSEPVQYRSIPPMRAVTEQHQAAPRRTRSERPSGARAAIGGEVFARSAMMFRRSTAVGETT